MTFPTGDSPYTQFAPQDEPDETITENVMGAIELELHPAKEESLFEPFTEGDYASQCTTPLEFGNTGNFESKEQILQYYYGEDFEPGGLGFAPDYDQEQACQQATEAAEARRNSDPIVVDEPVGVQDQDQDVQNMPLNDQDIDVDIEPDVGTDIEEPDVEVGHTDETGDVDMDLDVELGGYED